ncbi:MAG: PEP-CTERM sorting domain-containing protein [Paucibacter sp.]|nr:PEP-CTERM sorting domain-containing protein [Roseateles sp.]
MKLPTLLTLGLAATLGLGSTQAATLNIDVSDTASFDALGSVHNVVFTRMASAGALVGSLAWNVSLTAYGDSWLQDMRVRISNTAGDGITLTLDSLQEPGSQSYMGAANLSALGLAFNLGSDGLLRLEFFEDYDDAVGQIDGRWTAGTLSFDGLAAAVPEPASYGLLSLGLGALLLGHNARRSKLDHARRRCP